MGTTPNASTVPRVEMEAWLHDFVHEIRNHLNDISLESVNLTDTLGASSEGAQLQLKVQLCGAYLKLIRDAIAPETPRFVRTSLKEILLDVHNRGLGNRLVWPPDKQDILENAVGLDKFQVCTALELLIRDALELSEPGEPMILSWAEAFSSKAIGLQLSFHPAGEYVPVEVARWGKAFDAKVGGVLRRYQVARLLELNGGFAAWTYLKSGSRRMILAHVEFASMVDLTTA